jgi:Rap1a immunity proteins
MSRKSCWRLLIVVCVIVSYGPSLSKDNYRGWGTGFYSGEELFRLCTSKDALEQRECSAYICGVYDGFDTLYILGQVPNDRNMPYDICLPNKAGAVTCEDLKQEVLKIFEARPDIRKSDAGGVVGSAIHRAHPCCWDPLLTRHKQPPPPGCPQ